MSPEVQLVLGCLSLSLVVTWYLHASYRASYLQQDLIEIGNALRKTMQEKGAKVSDPRYRPALRFLDRMIRNAPVMSLSSYIQFQRAQAQVMAEPQMAASGEATGVKEPNQSIQLTTKEIIEAREISNGPLPPEVTDALMKGILRVTIHFLIGSPFFGLRVLWKMGPYLSRKYASERISKLMHGTPVAGLSKLLDAILSI